MPDFISFRDYGGKIYFTTTFTASHVCLLGYHATAVLSIVAWTPGFSVGACMGSVVEITLVFE